MVFMALAWCISNKSITMDVILTIAYVLCFIVIFWLFFKSVNYFENI